MFSLVSINVTHFYQRIKQTGADLKLVTDYWGERNISEVFREDKFTFQSGITGSLFLSERWNFSRSGALLQNAGIAMVSHGKGYCIAGDKGTCAFIFFKRKY